MAANHPGLPPPFGPRRFARWLRWAWLVEGAAQCFSGQVRHVRPAVARRLREGPAAGVPARRAATRALLGGTVFDLLAREEGESACVALACGPHRDGASGALSAAFGGRAGAPHGGRVALAPRPPGGRRTAVMQDSVFAPRYRALSVGVLMSVTIVAFQALGIGTAMPAIARDLGGLGLYGWSFSAFMLASIVGTVAAGRSRRRDGPRAALPGGGGDLRGRQRAGRAGDARGRC